MKLSENHLFHFTNKPALISIINEGFIPFFGFEFTEFDDYGTHPVRIEMFPRICFTDLPLNLIKRHIEKYDKYAIGMKKSWAVKNGLNPLLYIQKNSIVGATLSMLTETILAFHETQRASKINSPRLDIITSRMANLNHMLGRFTKPYEIEIDKTISHPEYQREFHIEADRYYDEREWRFVPYIKINELIEEGIWPLFTSDKKELERVSRKYIRTFELEDIVSIVIPSKKEETEIGSRLAERYDVGLNKVLSTIEFIQI